MKIKLLTRMVIFFWDVAVDVMVGKEQYYKTFPELEFPGKCFFKEK